MRFPEWTFPKDNQNRINEKVHRENIIDNTVKEGKLQKEWKLSFTREKKNVTLTKSTKLGPGSYECDLNQIKNTNPKYSFSYQHDTKQFEGTSTLGPGQYESCLQNWKKGVKFSQTQKFT